VKVEADEGLLWSQAMVRRLVGVLATLQYIPVWLEAQITPPPGKMMSLPVGL
jgi:hypothetical protein